jgi:hypothetical protein
MSTQLGIPVDEILDRAADLIDEYGWVTGAFRTPDGEMCILGAMNSVVAPLGQGHLSECYPRINGMPADLYTARSFLYKALGMSVNRWNDTYCTGGYEAAEFLRREAKHYREEIS